MTLLNAFVSHRKAMMLVDTEVLAMEKRRPAAHEVRAQERPYYFEGSKMLALPHANVIIGGRGHNVFLSTLLYLMHTRPGAFDEIEENMPSLLKIATGLLKKEMGLFVGLFSTSIYAQEIVLVGYSERRGRMFCIAYRSADKSGFEATEVDDAYHSPWDLSWGMPFDVYTPEHARFLSTVQVDNALALHPEAPFGGRLLLAELTKDELKMSSIARLTERALPPAAATAPSNACPPESGTSRVLQPGD